MTVEHFIVVCVLTEGEVLVDVDKPRPLPLSTATPRRPHPASTMPKAKKATKAFLRKNNMAVRASPRPRPSRALPMRKPQLS